MNFFGHAVIASRSDAAHGSVRAEFVLGSMLPDFASMLRVRPPRVTSAALEEGLRHHHATDDAFHGSESFLEFSRHASIFLGARGLSRGSARAVAHVGVELILDGALADDGGANEAYLCAVESGLTEAIASQIHWSAANGGSRFAQLCHTLASRGPARSNASPELIAERLRNILMGRPRLALDDAGQSVVREWVVTACPIIVPRAPALVREVEQRLAIAIGSER